VTKWTKEVEGGRRASPSPTLSISRSRSSRSSLVANWLEADPEAVSPKVDLLARADHQT